MGKAWIAIASLVVMSCFFAACKKGDIPAVVSTPIYDNPGDKLWAHRINTAKEANEMLGEFNGIETDIRWISEEDEFQIGHDYASGLSLDTFFDSLQNPSKYYFWLDFKNLEKENADAALGELQSLIKKYHLHKRVIVEARQAEPLSRFMQAGIFTSYWVTDFSDQSFQFVSIPYYRLEIQRVLRRYSFTTLSACYTMYPFINRYFGDYNIHLWTNGDETDARKKEIRDYAKNRNVKVILVDSRRNFLKN